jgi:cell division protein FtsB
MTRNSASPTSHWRHGSWGGDHTSTWIPDYAQLPDILPIGSEKGKLMKLPFQKKIYLIPAGCIVFILFFTVFGDKGLLRIYELKQDKTRINSRLSDAKNENEKLKLDIAALKTDRRYLESIARKDFGLVRSNEVIYQFPQEKK